MAERAFGAPDAESERETFAETWLVDVADKGDRFLTLVLGFEDGISGTRMSMSLDGIGCAKSTALSRVSVPLLMAHATSVCAQLIESAF